MGIMSSHPLKCLIPYTFQNTTFERLVIQLNNFLDYFYKCVQVEEISWITFTSVCKWRKYRNPRHKGEYLLSPNLY